MTAFGSPVVPLENGKATTSSTGCMSIFAGNMSMLSDNRLDNGRQSVLPPPIIITSYSSRINRIITYVRLRLEKLNYAKGV